MNTLQSPAEIRHHPFLLKKTREGSYSVFRVTAGEERRIGVVHQQPVNADKHALRWQLWLNSKEPSGYLSSIEAVFEELADTI